MNEKSHMQFKDRCPKRLLITPRKCDLIRPKAVTETPLPPMLASPLYNGPPIQVPGEREAHLWLVSLAVKPEDLSDFKSILSRDERDRAERFREKRHAQRYVVARGALRSLLGAYLGLGADELQFAYDSSGKPRLADERTSLGFNVSHSGDWALLGFTGCHKIGVDLEWVQGEIEFVDLAKRFFSPNEIQKLFSLPADQQRQAFYSGWTRKEAFLKARGEGLSRGLDRVEVSLAPDEPAAIIEASGELEACRAWTIQHLSPLPEYIGAAAVDAGNVAFRCFGWDADSQ